MSLEIYEIPNNLTQMFKDFEKGETSYRIINYDRDMEMDNNQSMNYFIECVGIPEDNIEDDYGTQIVVVHEDYNFRIVIDSGGLGDFFSHGFDMSLYEDETTIKEIKEIMLDFLEQGIDHNNPFLELSVESVRIILDNLK